MPDLLEPIAQRERLSPHFIALLESPGFASARAMVRDVYSTYSDKDGNFIEQFQTTGFDARIWELSIHAFLCEIGVSLDPTHARPDFCCTSGTQTFCVEAVTANQSAVPGRTASPSEDLQRYREGFRPIRLGSALYSKLQKRYWELPHVLGRPLVFAIEDFSAAESLFFGPSSLWQYLYGIRGSWYLEPDGQLIISEAPVLEHRHGTKIIPSGFFNQPGAENVSAVLFSNAGTVAKFNRIGLLKGYGRSRDIRMIRVGTCYDYTPNTARPAPFHYEVGDPGAPPEDWSQGLELYHNPRSVAPLPTDLLGIAYHVHDGTQLRSHLGKFHPFGSLTITLLSSENP